jgi:molecular chaperone GrpE (heat shock protein)
MNNPVMEAFLFGKAFAEVATEKVEESLTNVLSDLGKFDAETREKLREFAQEVKARAEASKENNTQGSMTISIESETVLDLQEVLDELRAEIARLKAELNNYRNQSP